MEFPESLYSYIKAHLRDCGECWPEAGAVASDCEDMLKKLEAWENGWDWKCAGYNID